MRIFDIIKRVLAVKNAVRGVACLFKTLGYCFVKIFSSSTTKRRITSPLLIILAYVLKKSKSAVIPPKLRNIYSWFSLFDKEFFLSNLPFVPELLFVPTVVLCSESSAVLTSDPAETV